MAVVVLVAGVTDVRSGKIYNAVTYPAIAAGLIGHTLAGGIGGEGASMGLVGALCGLAAGFLPLLAAWLAGGVGGGDAKLMGAVGALAGWRFVLAAMVYGLLIAALMAIFVMFRRRIARQTLGRILRSVYLAFTLAKNVDPATPESPKIAFGLALCIGSALAMLETLLYGPLAKKLMGI